MTQYQPQGFSLLPTAVKHLLIINALVFAADYVMQRQGLYLANYLALFSNSTGQFKLWQPLTYMFMHANFSHIFFNMFNLWMFGAAMENFWGTVTVGASAAVYGLLLAFGMTFPNEYIYLYFLMPIKTKWFIAGMIVIELIQGVFYSYDGVAHFAHLAGMLIGFLLIMWWRKHPFSRL